MVVGNITTQPKQGRQVVQMSSLSILLCLWPSYLQRETSSLTGIPMDETQVTELKLDVKMTGSLLMIKCD